MINQGYSLDTLYDELSIHIARALAISRRTKLRLIATRFTFCFGQGSVEIEGRRLQRLQSRHLNHSRVTYHVSSTNAKQSMVSRTIPVGSK
jgi:hypothetical protein